MEGPTSYGQVYSRRRLLFLFSAMALVGCAVPQPTPTAIPLATTAPANAAPPTPAAVPQTPVPPTVAVVPPSPTPPPPVAPPPSPAVPPTAVAPRATLPPLLPTPAQTEGPYFKSGSPERKSVMESGVVGDPLGLTGRVLTTDRIPMANVKLDFWQADGNGVYDNTGYRLRGHLFSDSEGGYALETVLPGLYPGRTRHIHLRVTAPGLSALTTQIYFPDEQRNSSDGIFSARLLASVQKSAQMTNAQFDIILEGTK